MKFKKPYFIAEISANHSGSLDKALKLIRTAKKNGADAVKIQTYTPESMTIKSDNKYFKLNKGLWKGNYLWDLYNKAKTPITWHKKLFEYSKKLGITLFSTPFDTQSVDLLLKLKCPIFKIASHEICHEELIEKVSKTKKPIIISTGMASLEEISKAYNIAKRNGVKDITLLYCVSNYPSKSSDFNLNNIKILKKKFKCRVGLSDHSNDNRVAIAAIAAGAEVIEKHIGYENQKTGFDIDFSIKGKEIRKLINDINITYNFFLKKNFYRSNTEIKSRINRRSIFVVKKIEKGDKFNKTNIKVIRPGYGASPFNYQRLIGKKSPKKFEAGEPITNYVVNKYKKN